VILPGFKEFAHIDRVAIEDGGAVFV